jgi:glycosyltransferase involved in cell wall biosynthesis
VKLSIIIPVYNSEKYLAKCLDSLVSQDIESKNYEILIINDGSIDKSEAIALSYAQKFIQIKVFNQHNRGVGSARNKGIELSNGKYIYFIDPDDFLADNVLNTLLIQANNFNLEILSFNSKPITNSNLTTNRTFKTSETLEIDYSNLKILTGLEYIGERCYKNEVWWYIIKKEFLISTGINFTVGRWMEDAIFTAQLFLKTKTIAHLEFDVHRHVKTPGSAMTSNEPKHYLKVIRDNANAAEVFNYFIKSIDSSSSENIRCIERLKTRQQSFVFFMMIRMLKSKIILKEIKTIIERMQVSNAYPLNSFLGDDYNIGIYYLLVKLFSNKHLFYIIFIICNPILNAKLLFKSK